MQSELKSEIERKTRALQDVRELKIEAEKQVGVTCDSHALCHALCHVTHSLDLLKYTVYHRNQLANHII